jgi:hypothetical protein
VLCPPSPPTKFNAPIWVVRKVTVAWFGTTIPWKRCWLLSIFDVTAIVHLSHYTDALKLTIVFCLYVISPFRLLKNDSMKLSYFVPPFPFPKILLVSYMNLLIHYLFFSNKDLHPPCSISGNFKDLWSKCYLKACWEHQLAERLKIDK